MSKTKQRKKKHLSICINPHEYAVEHGSPGFDHVRFIHQALPEMDAAEIETTVDFLGTKISAPIFISCMTGGSEEGFRANRNLAIAAEEARIPVGMGSIRVLLEHDEVFDHFHLKRYAPSVPVLANIGGVQLRDLPHARLIELVKRLEADSLVIHLNPGQELFQRDGDRDFRGIRDAIGRFCELSPIPIIVKETGFGVTPELIPELVALGVAYVDVAGAGGTNWISVESFRDDKALAVAGQEFDEWGMPTALILASIRKLYAHRYDDNLIASGGLRSGQDFAKSIALGATIAGAALPFIRAEVSGGVEGVVELLDSTIATIRRVMTLTGSGTIGQLRTAPLWFDASLAGELASFTAATDRTLHT